MIHEEKKSDDSSKKTSNVWNNRVEFMESTGIDVFISWFSEAEIGVPPISYFLSRYCGWQHDKTSFFHSFILVGKDTMIRLYLEIWDEDLVGGSEFIPKVDEIFIRHVVGYSLFWTGTDQGIDVVYWEMYFIGQFSGNLTLIGAGGVGMEGSAVQDGYLEIVEVVGSPFTLNKKLGVGVRTVPICGVHAVEVA